MKFYGGKTHIIPMDIETFLKFIEHAKSVGGVKSNQLYDYFKFIIKKNGESEDEEEWLETIKESAQKWTTVI